MVLNVNAKDTPGSTPLHYAAGKGNKEMMAYLAEKDDDVDVEDNYGHKPLHVAVGGYKEVVDFPETVDSAVISPNGAFLFAKIKLKAKGTLDVKISKLPTSVGDNVKMDIGIRNGILTNMGFETEELPYDPKTYKDLEEKVRTAEKNSSYVKAQLSEVEYYINLLNASLDAIKNGKVGNINEYLRLSGRLSGYHIKRDSLSKVLDDLNAELESLKDLRQELLTEQGIITLHIENANDPTIDLVIFYPSGNFGWKPEYTVEYKTGGNMKISALAKFTSNLPRKVSAKKVIITNIPPSFFAKADNPPSHTPWYIIDRPRIVELQMREDVATLTLKEEGIPKTIPKTPEITFTPISTRFVINREITFDRSNPAIAQLFEKTYKVKELVFIYPELSEKAYISAVFKPDMDLPSGNMKVFFNGELLADYFYKGAQRGEEDTLFLGFDPFIKGNVKLLEQKRKDDIMGKKTREERTYRITITNNRNKSVKITLFVRKPFSSGNVNIADFSTEPKPQDDLGEGLLMWKVNLKPKESFTVKRRIVITYPKGNFVEW